MKDKTRHIRYYRNPRTTQERRENNKRNKFARAKRNQKNLPSNWDDKQACVQKTWKVKRKTQYYVNGRGEKHQLIIFEELGGSVNSWSLEKWFRSHNIACRIEPIRRIEHSVRIYRLKYVQTGFRQQTVKHRIRPKTKKGITRYDVHVYRVPTYEYKPVKLDKPVELKNTRLIGHEITWWTNKNIDIDKVISGFIVN